MAKFGVRYRKYGTNRRYGKIYICLEKFSDTQKYVLKNMKYYIFLFFKM